MLDVIDVGFSPDLVPYQEAWDLQRRIHDEVVTGQRLDTVLLLEHEPVYTAGKRTNSWDRPLPEATTTPVVDVDRGGKITWHGPGQLVGYPIVRLTDPVDVVAYVRRLESLLMDVCGTLGVSTMRVDGRSGVWMPADARRPERKVAAIGVRVARGVTMHGFAVNANNSLEPFHRIVPCGIADAGVTTLSAELGRDVTVREVHGLVRERLGVLVGVPRPDVRTVAGAVR
jgi:lipoyl(octanoyl) transferase